MKVRAYYKNWKGECAWRVFLPLRLWYGCNQWHESEQWLLDAYDFEVCGLRTYAVKDILEWTSS